MIFTGNIRRDIPGHFNKNNRENLSFWTGHTGTYRDIPIKIIGKTYHFRPIFEVFRRDIPGHSGTLSRFVPDNRRDIPGHHPI